MDKIVDDTVNQDENSTGEEQGDFVETNTEADTDFTVSTLVDYKNTSVSLVTIYEKKSNKWSTCIKIRNKISAPIPHNNPLYMPEHTRDQQFIERIESSLEVKQKVAKTILNELIDKASQDKSKIDKLLETENLNEEEVQKKVESRNEQKAQDEQIKTYFDILKNESGNHTKEVIEATIIGLIYMLTPTFWYAKEVSEKITVVLNKFNIADFVRTALNVINTGMYLWRYDWNDAFYKYDEDDLTIKNLSFEIMYEVGKPDYQYNGNITKDLKDILTAVGLGPSVHLESPFNKYKGLINTKNGVIKLDYENRKAILIGKNPRYMFNYCIDTYFDPNADPTPIDNFLEEVVGLDQKDFIYQIVALAIRDTDLDLEPSKVCYFLHGPRHSGKNMILRLLFTCIGMANTSTIPLHDLAANQFVKALLEGKLLNVNDEVQIAGSISESREIKTLTGGKRHTLNRKNTQQYQSYITAVLVFAGNNFPRYDVPREDEAFWDRWDIIKFRKQFPVNESYGAEIFTPENMSGFLNKVIEKLFDIHDNGVKRLCSSPLDTYNQWKLGSSSVYKFVHEAMVETKTQMTHIKSELHKAYREWCEDPANNISRESIRYQADTFGKDLVMECGAIQGRSGNHNVYKICRQLKEFTNQAIQDNVESEASSTRNLDSFTEQASDKNLEW
jgi:P4 family phage/plasmid primase-like protien